MTLQELIDRAQEQAGLGAIQGFDAGAVAESLLGEVFEGVARALAGDGRSASLPRLTKTVTFANGAATVSSDVLTRCRFDSSLYDPDDTTKVYSLVPEWDDFTQVYDTRLGYYTFRGGTALYVIEPGEGYEDGEGLDGDLRLTIPCVPAVPAAASTAIDAPQEFVTEVLAALTERLKGLAERSVAA